MSRSSTARRYPRSARCHRPRRWISKRGDPRVVAVRAQSVRAIPRTSSYPLPIFDSKGALTPTASLAQARGRPSIDRRQRQRHLYANRSSRAVSGAAMTPSHENRPQEHPRLMQPCYLTVITPAAADRRERAYTGQGRLHLVGFPNTASWPGVSKTLVPLQPVKRRAASSLSSQARAFHRRSSQLFERRRAFAGSCRRIDEMDRSSTPGRGAGYHRRRRAGCKNDLSAHPD